MSEPVEAGLEPRLRLALEAFGLKDVERAGWVLRGVRRPESVADHSFGTALLCLLFAGDAGVDPSRSVQVALVHDLAETVVGDVAARADASDRSVSEAEKAAAERGAMARLVPAEAAGVGELWLEYEQRATPEARFVRDMNLVDMCLQALRYERDRRYDPARPIDSSGGYVHLDEFFASAEPRLATDVGRDLFDAVRRGYMALRNG